MIDLSVFQKVAFSGSRGCKVAASVVRGVFPYLRQGVEVSVGCATGVDFVVRSEFKNTAKVFRASDYKKGDVRAALAARSAACVKSVCPGGLVVVVPKAGQSCPEVVKVKKSWVSCGSGSWSSAALALGLGCSVLLWVSPGTKPPAWAVLAKGAAEVCPSGGEWWLLVYPQEKEAPAGIQKELF